MPSKPGLTQQQSAGPASDADPLDDMVESASISCCLQFARLDLVL